MHSDQPRRGWSVAVKLILAGWLLDALSFFFFPLIGYDIGAMIAQLFGVAPKIKISASFLDLFGFAVIIRSLVDLVDQIGGGMLGAPFQDVQATVKVGYGFLWTVLFLTLAGYGVFLFSLGRWSASAHQEAWPQNPGHMLNLTSFGVGILHFLYTLLLFWQQSASEGGITYLSFGAWFLFLAGIMGHPGLLRGACPHPLRHPRRPWTLWATSLPPGWKRSPRLRPIPRYLLKPREKCKPGWKPRKGDGCRCACPRPALGAWPTTTCAFPIPRFPSGTRAFSSKTVVFGFKTSAVQTGQR